MVWEIWSLHLQEKLLSIIELKCGLGNLELDDSLETSITSGNKQITNEGATKNIKLDCGMGNVEVEFEED